MRQQLTLGVGLRDRALFETFHPGPNTHAHAHLVELARGRHEPVVLLSGAAATGKTHLLQAVCAEAGGLARPVGYVALGAHADYDPEVLGGWDELDVVCLDDLQAIAGAGEWERAVFRLFNGLRERGASLVVATRAAPAALGLRLPDLTSRLRSGPVFHLRPPGDEDRLEAIRLRAAWRGLLQ